TRTLLATAPGGIEELIWAQATDAERPATTRTTTIARARIVPPPAKCGQSSRRLGHRQARDVLGVAWPRTTMLALSTLSASCEAARILGGQEVTPASRGERRRLL